MTFSLLTGVSAKFIHLAKWALGPNWGPFWAQRLNKKMCPRRFPTLYVNMGPLRHDHRLQSAPEALADLAHFRRVLRRPGLRQAHVLE